MDDLERFWANVYPEPTALGCRIWVGGYSEVSGYGGFSVLRDGKQRAIAAHRASYILNVGPIPDGMLILHGCESLYPPGDFTCRLCVEPTHLRPGTAKENAADVEASGRGKAWRLPPEMRVSEASLLAHGPVLELALQERDRRRVIRHTPSPSRRRKGGQQRGARLSTGLVKFRLTDAELAQLDAYVAKHGRDRSYWVRLAMVDAGLLKRPKGVK